MPPGLRSLQFFPTFRCNQACGFCFNRGLAADEDCDAERFDRVLDVMSDSGIPELDILGGEPTLLSHLSERIDRAVSQEIAVNISTNGSNVPLLNRLAGRFPREQLRIGISLNEDGVADGLAAFINAHRPILKTVCTRMRTLPDLVEHYVRLPHTEFFLIFMDAIRQDDADSTISYPEYRRRLAELKQRCPNVHEVVCSGFLPDTDRYPELAGVRCPAGTTKLSVMPDGSVYPCYLLFSHPEFRLGNILNSSLPSMLNNTKLDFFRTFQGNPCKERSCEYHSECHGGCPAVSLLVTGDRAAPDPRCQSQ
ncbi:MAG TPA: radical SAM protein [Dissulfurispiraceae bacterium]|nr:radical SAM protein [Dissulfurispiraceae bacterium]